LASAPSNTGHIARTSIIRRVRDAGVVVIPPSYDAGMKRSALREAIDEIAAEDRNGWSVGARSAHLLELLEARERLDAEVLRAVGEWDAAGAYTEDGACTPVAWLAHRAPVSKADAVGLVRGARLAHRHPRTGKLLASGDVSTAHVDVLAQAVRRREDLYPEHEDTLLDAARTLRPELFRHVAQRWRSLADDVLADEEAQVTFGRRFVHCSKTIAGTVRGDFELDAEAGAVVLAALEARDRPDPADTPGGARSRAQRWADALVEIASSSLGSEGTQRHAMAVDVVVDAGTLAGEPPADLTAARCDLDGVGPVARSTALRLSCDAAIGRVVRRGDSEILDLGRRSRLPTAAQRRALVHRDGGCGFPGCDAPHWWCDAHHIDHWTAGGPTDLDNLMLLCRRHHVLCHEGRWRLIREVGGEIRALPP
jgi:hypothetical protein